MNPKVSNDEGLTNSQEERQAAALPKEIIHMQKSLSDKKTTRNNKNKS